MRRLAVALFVGTSSLAVPSLVIAQTSKPAVDAAAPATIQVTSLRLLRDKNVISQAEYESALKDIGASIGAQATEAPALVIGKWSTSIYGFIEGDAIVDTTQSFGDVAGNGLVQRQDRNFAPPPAVQSTYAGDHGRVQFSVRNTRFGLRLKAPELAKVRASATLEMDFLGTDPSIDPTSSGTYPLAGSSEASFWNNPTMRVRLAYFKVESPIVDMMVGQSWHLFGWQPTYHPNSVLIQGLPGELYGRTMQVRISKTIPTGPTSLEVAVAALRPPQRNSMIPEFTGGLRLSLDKWKGMNTRGSTARELTPLSVALTGTMRNWVTPEFVSLPTKTKSLTTAAVAVTAFVPIIPVSKGHSLSIGGQIMMGSGIADLLTGMTGGMAFPSLAKPAGTTPPAYPQDVENGEVVYDTCANGTAQNDPRSSCFDLHGIQWNVFMAGVQYYLPGLDGRVWISGNYAHIQSPNVADYTRKATTAPAATDYNYVNAAAVRQAEDFFDACLFVDPLPSVRVGVEYAHFDDQYVDRYDNSKHVRAVNHRGQLSGFFIF